MKIVHQMRAGAPDKINIWTDGSYILRKHDNTNLVDYTFEELTSIKSRGEYILPADEGDILHANYMASKGIVNEGFILLPQRLQHEGRLHTINYHEFVPKCSALYDNLVLYTGVQYPEFQVRSVKNLESDADRNYFNDRGSREGVALKTITGSGSRGVILIDPRRVGLGGKYVSEMTKEQYINFLSYSRSECGGKIIIQDMIPDKPTLTKVNVDFVIRDGQLLGYKWDKTDPKAVFTNWDFGWFIRSEYTDEVMSKISSYLIEQYGIHNAIMNFEAFSDMDGETWLIEFNWRYSNSMFEGQALGIDMIGHYLRKEPFHTPFGEHKFSRYWQCRLYNDIKGYHDGK